MNLRKRKPSNPFMKWPTWKVRKFLGDYERSIEREEHENKYGKWKNTRQFARSQKHLEDMRKYVTQLKAVLRARKETFRGKEV